MDMMASMNLFILGFNVLLLLGLRSLLQAITFSIRGVQAVAR